MFSWLSFELKNIKLMKNTLYINHLEIFMVKNLKQRNFWKYYSTRISGRSRSLNSRPCRQLLDHYLKISINVFWIISSHFMEIQIYLLSEITAALLKLCFLFHPTKLLTKTLTFTTIRVTEDTHTHTHTLTVPLLV